MVVIALYIDRTEKTHSDAETTQKCHFDLVAEYPLLLPPVGATRVSC